MPNGPFERQIPGESIRANDINELQIALENTPTVSESGVIISVNTKTGVVVLAADDISDAATTKKFTTAADIAKLAGVAAGATANDTDANLRVRANHTGIQSADTLVDGLTNVAFLLAERVKLAGLEDIVIQASAPATPVEGDLWYDIDELGGGPLTDADINTVATTINAAVGRGIPTAAGTAREIVRLNASANPIFVPSGFFSADDYGAVADGVTDNATAFASLVAAVNAVANTDGTPVSVQFSGNSDGKSYRYSSGLAFTRPVVLWGDGGAILDYTGTGMAVKLGPDGLTDLTYQNQRRYIMSDLIFTGGATMEQGIYLNDHIVEPRLYRVQFIGFGNATAYGVYGQADNWDVLISECDWYAESPHANIRRNWIRMRGYHITSNGHASVVAGEADYGNTHLRMVNCHGTNLSAGGMGVWTNGACSIITGCKIEGFDPNIRIGSWGAGTKIVHNYFETVRITGSEHCIEYGDPVGGDRPTIYLEGLVVDGNYSNLHFDDIALSAFFVGRTQASVGLHNSVVDNNRVSGLNPALEMIRIADIAGQIGNVASGNNGFTKLRTRGGVIPEWGGEQGGTPLFRNHADVDMYLNIQPGRTANQSGGFQLLGFDGTVKIQAYYSPGANRFYLQHVAGNKTVSIDGDGNWHVSGALLATNGIGVGNSLAATTLGTVTKKIQVYDAAGASLGFVAVYNTIT